MKDCENKSPNCTQGLESPSDASSGLLKDLEKFKVWLWRIRIIYRQRRNLKMFTSESRCKRVFFKILNKCAFSKNPNKASSITVTVVCVPWSLFKMHYEIMWYFSQSLEKPVSFYSITMQACSFLEVFAYSYWAPFTHGVFFICRLRSAVLFLKFGIHRLCEKRHHSKRWFEKIPLCQPCIYKLFLSFQ